MNYTKEQINEIDHRILALAQHLEIEDPTDIKNELGNEYHVMGKSEEYIVVTDKEADELEDESLNNYIDDCLEIPEHIKPYFDEDKWKSDARLDGRGHLLNTYDGAEDSETIDGVEYFIYRIN